MPSGSCLCGDIKYKFSGEPVAVSACHCLPCRKTSGTSNSINVIVPDDKFETVSGSYKNFTRKGDSGKHVTYSFCPNCPTLLFVEVEAFPGMKVIKAGTIDEEDRKFLDGAKPGKEIYTKNRFDWCTPINGAEQATAS